MKNLFRYVAAIAVVLFVGCTFAACNDDDDDDTSVIVNDQNIVGTWTYTSSGDYSGAITIHSNGTWSMVETDDGEEFKYSGTYTTSDTYITIKYKDDGETYTEKIYVYEGYLSWDGDKYTKK